MRVAFKPQGPADSRGGKHGAQRGIERAGTKRRIKKTDPAARWQQALGVAQEVQGKRGRRRKLPQAIALGPRLLRIQGDLKLQTQCFAVSSGLGPASFAPSDSGWPGVGRFIGLWIGLSLGRGTRGPLG